MKTDALKDVTYYEGLRYTVTLRKDDEGDFVARIVELPGCLAHGEDEASAIKNLRSVQRLWIEEAISSGSVIPEPENDAGLPSGKWLQRVPRRLHRDLVNAARRDNISLNQLVTSMLSEALAVSSCAYAFQTFVARASQPIHPHGPVLTPFGWPSEACGYGEGRWAVTSQARIDDIVQSLSRIRNLKPSHFLNDPYADEHTETTKQLARK